MTTSTTVLWAQHSVSIDWLTATCTDERLRYYLRDQGHDALAKSKSDGNEVSRWEWHGYRGVSSRFVSVGERDDSAICRLEGYLAAEYWPYVAGVATNVSRIDLQVTAVANPPVPNLAVEGYRRATKTSGMGAGRNARPTLTVSPTGQTLYVGSRASERFGRLYDKHAQSPALYPAGAWRWEAEYKGKSAWAMARHLMAFGLPESQIPALVHSYFSRHGHSPPWPERFDPRAFMSVKEASSIERTLKWLREGVAPRLVELGMVLSGGEILAALGLQNNS